MKRERRGREEGVKREGREKVKRERRGREEGEKRERRGREK